MKHKKSKLIVILIGIGIITKYFCSHKTVKHTGNSTANNDLWDMVLYKAKWDDLETDGDTVRAYYHSLKNDPATKEYGHALALFASKKLAIPFGHQEESGFLDGGKITPTSATEHFESCPEGIELASLWLNELMRVKVDDRIKWMRNEGVFTLITPDQEKGTDKWFVLFCIILFILAIIKIINQ